MSSAPVPRPGILEIAPYIGGEAQAGSQTRLIRLASNESVFGPSPLAIEAYRALSDNLHRYPDGGAEALVTALQTQVGLESTRVVCGAGSDELISLLVRAYAGPGDEVLYPAHGFLMYGIAARTVGAVPVTAPETRLTADVDALLARVTPRTRLVFLANPNNPTGSWLPASEIRRLHAGLPGSVLMVIDAAYAEFVSDADYSDGRELVAGSANVVLLRTFSKIYGLAALRLGWALCPPAVADVLHRVRGPFNVNAAAQAAALAALADQAYVERVRAETAASRAWFTAELTARGLTVYPSVGNFVLVDFSPWGEAEAIRLALKSQGVLVRQMGVYRLGHCLRITIGRRDEMIEVVAALDGCRG